MDLRAAWTALLGLGLAVPVFAQAQAPGQPKDDEKMEATAAQNKGTDKQLDKLAAKYNVPESEIRSLRARGMGWGEISHALAIAQKAGAPVADVLKLRQSGMGWGKIAQHYGFKLGEVTGQAKTIRAEGEKAEKMDKDDRLDRDRKDDDRDAVRARDRDDSRPIRGSGAGDRGMGHRR